MGRTKIEWTDKVWNPVTGCTKVSQGCKHCYAERFSKRLGQEFTKVMLHPERLDDPLHWRAPRKIFVNSMSDLFHDDVPFEFVDNVFSVMAAKQRHAFQILTKRPERMNEYINSRRSRSYEVWSEMAGPFNNGMPIAINCWPFPNVWLGVSVEDQATADQRIPLLLRTPAAVRFVSCEPLLQQIDLGWGLKGGLLNPHPTLDWVIVGGESGPGARPMHPDWARSIRDQCEAANVPLFFKQWGEWKPVNPWGSPDWCTDIYGDVSILTADGAEWNGGVMPVIDVAHTAWEMQRVGKKKAGRLLDGKDHNEFPIPF